MRRKGKKYGIATNATLKYCPICAQHPIPTIRQRSHLQKPIAPLSLKNNHLWKIWDACPSKSHSSSFKKSRKQKIERNYVYEDMKEYSKRAEFRGGRHRPDFLFKPVSSLLEISDIDELEQIFPSWFLFHQPCYEHTLWESLGWAQVDAHGGYVRRMVWGGSGDPCPVGPAFHGRMNSCSPDSIVLFVPRPDPNRRGRLFCCAHSNKKYSRMVREYEQGAYSTFSNIGSYASAYGYRIKNIRKLKEKKQNRKTIDPFCL